MKMTLHRLPKNEMKKKAGGGGEGEEVAVVINKMNCSFRIDAIKYAVNKIFKYINQSLVSWMWGGKKYVNVIRIRRVEVQPVDMSLFCRVWIRHVCLLRKHIHDTWTQWWAHSCSPSLQLKWSSALIWAWKIKPKGPIFHMVSEYLTLSHHGIFWTRALRQSLLISNSWIRVSLRRGASESEREKEKNGNETK